MFRHNRSGDVVAQFRHPQQQSSGSSSGSSCSGSGRARTQDELEHEDAKKKHFLQLGRAAVVSGDPQKPSQAPATNHSSM